MKVDAPVAAPLRKIAGFEASDYRWHGERIVWAGAGAVDHPRNVRLPWQPAPLVCDEARLRTGAQACIHALRVAPAASAIAPKGLLCWLLGRPLAFPLDRAAGRFDALRGALETDDLVAFEAAALRVLGLGPGLTPSGDDLLGGLFFALAAAPRRAWAGELPALRARLLAAAAQATNVISAALLADLMQGRGWCALHEFVDALQRGEPAAVAAAAREVLAIGANSGGDLLAGLLLGLTALPCAPPSITANPGAAPPRAAS
jgi:hypothetical protein